MRPGENATVGEANELVSQRTKSDADVNHESGRFVCDLRGDVFTTNDERKEHVFAVHELQAEDA